MKDNRFFILHIRDSIREIEKFTKGVSRDKFFKSSLIQSAVIRQIEIIGEAARNLTADYKKKHSSIPWRDIVDMRNKLIHEYFGIDKQVVWNTITLDLPQLKTHIDNLLK
jgi:uncharacterized protein with HEPN domain